MLNSLDKFLHEVEPEVERMGGGEGEDSLSLMALMTIFNRVRNHVYIRTCLTIPYHF